jgi:hypothetical protein
LLALARPSFNRLAEGLHRCMLADFCDESCAHVHDSHECTHQGHSCGCAHSDRYGFEFTWPEEIEPAEILPFLSAFIAQPISGPINPSRKSKKL